MKKLKTLRNDLQLISKMGIIDWKQPSFYNLQTFAFEHIVYQSTIFLCSNNPRKVWNYAGKTHTVMGEYHSQNCHGGSS